MSTTIKKTIQINPDLFKINSNKTKKNREKKSIIPSMKPLISPNILKNKLLNRIKEHKRKENESLGSMKHSKVEEKTNNNTNNININSNSNTFQEEEEQNNYTNEFNDSIEYLQTLSKQKKIDNEKELYEKKMLKKREELQNKTLKNMYASSSSSSSFSSSPFVHIDLPEELASSLIPVKPNEISTLNPIRLKSDDIPYGILKGGDKPTYREWNKTRKNLEVTDPNAAMIVNTSANSERERRLQFLKEKIKKKQSFVPINNPTLLPLLKNEDPPVLEQDFSSSDQDINSWEKKIMNEPLIQKTIPIVNHLNAIPTNLKDNSKTIIQEEINIPKKRFLKKTIKRKYTLGKSKIKKTIAVLMKDRFTRKKIISAQKDLKKKPIQEIKKFLREHHLIKVGSNSPNDILRKMYESAMLTGEVTNNNKDTLLHNFLQDDEGTNPL